MILGLVRRTFGSKNRAGISAAYKALERPILEYGCPVWNAYLVKQIHAMESIQRRATRLICGPDKTERDQDFAENI